MRYPRRTIAPSLCAGLGLVLAAATALAGCSGTAAVSPPAPAIAVASGKTWMAHGAAKQPNLLYVSNAAAGDVTVYTYADGGGLLLVGTLTGFAKPRGMCTDKKGDVWITDSSTRRVYRYRHGGTKAVGMIREQAASPPYACAVDPTTGNVAVSNQFNGLYQPIGNVKVYAKSERTVTKYGVHHLQPYYVAYDNKGNLFVDAELPFDRRVSLLELPKLGDRFVHLKLSDGSLAAPGALAWINPTLLVGDETSDGQGAFAHKVFISGFNATIVGQMSFSDTHEASGFYRRGTKIVVPDPAANSVAIYTFPGGSLYATLTKSIAAPAAAVISQAGSGS
ncbi:MAG TPA: hypothetical protein VGF86_06970 [Candidatus Tumulicola sp.]|jgi:hypothetical protein